MQAQEARRILDRLYGYEVSPLLWRKVKPKLSAGRVQSVAVRLDRRARTRTDARSFRRPGGTSLAAFAKQGQASQFDGTLVSVDGRRLPSGKDFDSPLASSKAGDVLLLDDAGAENCVQRLQSGKFRVTAMEETPYTSKPSPPFTTSTMQQEANRKLGFTARRTMTAAQSLYRKRLHHLHAYRLDDARRSRGRRRRATLVRTEYGPRISHRDAANVSVEGEERSRGARSDSSCGPSVRIAVGSLESKVGPDEFRLFELIWKRTIASQMEDARGRSISATLESDGVVFRVSGRTIDFAGFLRAYVEGSDDPDAAARRQGTNTAAARRRRNGRHPQA